MLNQKMKIFIENNIKILVKAAVWCASSTHDTKKNLLVKFTIFLKIQKHLNSDHLDI